MGPHAVRLNPSFRHTTGCVVLVPGLASAPTRRLSPELDGPPWQCLCPSGGDSNSGASYSAPPVFNNTPLPTMTVNAPARAFNNPLPAPTLDMPSKVLPPMSAR